MSSKRDLDDVEDGEMGEHQAKRPRKQNNKARQHQHSGIDATSGQKHVFSHMNGGTTIPAGEESDFEDDKDAMAYLRSVRQEAGGIPHLLVAPKVQIGPQLPADMQDEGEYDEDDEPIDRSIYTNGIGDTKGWYEDGAYIAKADDWDNYYYDDEDYEDGEAYGEEEDVDPALALHEAYFEAVMSQYLRLRAIVNSEAPPGAASRLSKDHQTSVAPFGRNSHTIGTWARLFRDTDPHPVQLALMSKESVLRLIEVLLGGKFLRMGYSLPERTSRWLWALLARLPDRGELNHLEIGWVRDLGRRAVLLGRSLAEMAALREELEDGDLGVNEAVYGSSDDEEVMDTNTDTEARDVSGQPSPPTSTLAPETKSPAPQGLETPQNGGDDDDDAEEGEVEEDEDVAMEIASNSESDEAAHENLEDAKARLLAQIDAAEAEATAEAARERARMNMRATVNMILTVAGEFYGQRDLLEFREPFVGM